MRRKLAISDLHFDHKRIIELCNRPFSSVEEMNEQMVLRWNSVVDDDDDVYFGGDFGFNDKKVAGWFEKLNGVKHLVMGNHDRTATTKLGWYSVHTRMEVEHNGTLFVLDHYPIEDWNKRYHDSVHLYGHVHTVPVMELRRRFSMCAEHLNYTPRDLDVFVKMALAQV
jgi:calcineurin-like phosphoesterase family protein